MKTLFDSAAYEEVIRRVDAITSGSARQWGTMSPAQMLAHTARALEIATGKRQASQMLLGKLIAWVFRKDFVGEKPFQKNGPTAPDFVVRDEPSLEQVRHRVKVLLADLHAQGPHQCEGRVHAFFGRLTGEEWGVTQFKHMDHHLRQFGA